MKKCLSVLLAGALTAAMGMTAFALEIDGETDQLVIGQEEEEEIQLAGALLTPGESYTFPLSVTVDGVTMELTEELLDEEDWRIRLEENYGAEAVASCRVEEDGGDYSLQLTLKGGYPVEQTEAKYTLTLTDRKSRDTLLETEVEFTCGYGQMADEEIEALDEGDSIEITAETPVLTAGQLETIGELNRYNAVLVEGEGWSYLANTYGHEGLNFYYDTKPVEAMLEQFADDQMKFLNFPAQPDFGRLEELRIDMSEDAEDYDGQFYAYRLLGDKLLTLKCTYDEDTEELVLRTRSLGQFVITDHQIPNGTTVSGQPAGQQPAAPSSPEQGAEGGSQDESRPNPETGAGDGIAAAAAVMLLSGGAALALRKK